MAIVKPDLSEVQDEVGPGTYRGVIRKGEIKEWPNGGQYINWELETYGEEMPKNNGRRIFHKTATSGKGVFMLQRFYKAATGKVMSGEFDTEQLVGKKVMLDLVDGVRNGEPTGYTEVKTVRPVSP